MKYRVEVLVDGRWQKMKHVFDDRRSADNVARAASRASDVEASRVVEDTLEPGDPGPIGTVEQVRAHADPSNDPRCKDHTPDAYEPPPARCDENVHYAPCPLADGRQRRDLRPWWQRLLGIEHRS